MKVLIISSKYFPAVGGLETAVRAVSNEFLFQGHEVLIITNRFSRKLCSEEKIGGIPVRRFFFTDYPPKTGNFWIWFKYLVRLVIVPIESLRFISTIKKFGPDIVHLHYVGAPALYVLGAKKRLSFPLVISVHGSDVEDFISKQSFQKKRLLCTLQQADFVTANAEHLMRKMTDAGVIKNHKGSVIPMGFSSEDYNKAAAYSSSVPYLFAAGRFIHKKGFDVLIHAFSRLIKKADYPGNLLIAGAGEELGNYRRLCEEMKLKERVVFLGLLDSQTLAGVMKGCDLFVVPSREEAFGIVVLEALYAGKKVVASRAGGIPDIMKDNPQMLTSVNDPEDLAEKLHQAINKTLCWNAIDPEELKRKYSWRRVADDYLKVYQSLLKRK